MCQGGLTEPEEMVGALGLIEVGDWKKRAVVVMDSSWYEVSFGVDLRW